MKRFTSILCALLVLLSANAAPQFKSLSNDAEKAQIAPVEQLQKTKLTKSELRAKREARVQKAVANRSKAPKAKNAVIDVTIGYADGTFYDNSAYGTADDIFYELDADDLSRVFLFDIYLENGQKDVVSGKTYTLEDMEPYYAFYVDETENYFDYVAASFTKTVGADGSITIVARVEAEDGNTFNLSYYKAPVVISNDTINIEITESIDKPKFYSDGSVQVLGANNDYSLSLCYFTETKNSAVGSYTVEDFDLSINYTYVRPKSAGSIKIVDATVVATETSDRINFRAQLKGENGNVYNVSMFYIKPEIFTKNITIHSFTSASGGSNSNRYVTYTLTSDDGNYLFTFVFKTGSASDITNGQTYTEANLRTQSTSRGTDYVRMQYISYSTLTFVKGLNEEEKITINATILDTEGNTWNLTYLERELGPTELHLQYDNSSTPFDEVFEVYDVSSEDGSLSFVAENENNGYISLQIFASELTAGVYEINSSKENGTILASVGVQNYIQPSFAGFKNPSTGQFSTATLWFLQVGTLTVAEDGSAVLDALNSYGISVKATFGAPLPPHLQYDMNADIEYDFVDYVATAGEGFIEITADDNTNLYSIDIVLFTASDTLVPGTYPVSDTKAVNTVLASSGYVAGTGFSPSVLFNLVYQSGSYYLNDPWFFTGGSITVNVDGSITLNAVNSLGKSITGTLTPAIPNEKPVIGEIVTTPLSNSVSITIAATDDITATENLEVYILDESFLEIATTYNATTGLFEATITDLEPDTEYSYYVWVEDEAGNYAFEQFSFTTLSNQQTAVDNINASSIVTKRIEKGQLVIIKNGVKYNTVGSVIR